MLQCSFQNLIAVAAESRIQEKTTWIVTVSYLTYHIKMSCFDFTGIWRKGITLCSWQKIVSYACNILVVSQHYIQIQLYLIVSILSIHLPITLQYLDDVGFSYCKKSFHQKQLLLEESLIGCLDLSNHSVRGTSTIQGMFFIHPTSQLYQQLHFPGHFSPQPIFNSVSSRVNKCKVCTVRRGSMLLSM